jgi:hypothetical protein
MSLLCFPWSSTEIANLEYSQLAHKGLGLEESDRVSQGDRKNHHPSVQVSWRHPS